MSTWGCSGRCGLFELQVDGDTDDWWRPKHKCWQILRNSGWCCSGNVHLLYTVCGLSEQISIRLPVLSTSDCSLKLLLQSDLSFTVSMKAAACFNVEDQKWKAEQCESGREGASMEEMYSMSCGWRLFCVSNWTIFVVCHCNCLTAGWGSAARWLQTNSWKLNLRSWEQQEH